MPKVGRHLVAWLVPLLHTLATAEKGGLKHFHGQAGTAVPHSAMTTTAAQNESRVDATTTLAKATTRVAASATTLGATTTTIRPDTMTTTRPVTWLSLIGHSYYINLPSTDNWSTYGPLKTRWSKLRIVGSPHIGATSVMVDLHDWTFSVSNGKNSTAQNLQRIEWGIAAGCSSPPASEAERLESEMIIDLVGTPFRYTPVSPEAKGSHAYGQVMCSHEGQLCNASCGGWCGYCGLGEPSVTTTTMLEVIDRERFDAALTSLMDAAQEALRTTTHTATSTTTMTTSTATSTGSTTATSTQTTRAAFLSPAATGGTSIIGLGALTLTAAGVGLALGYALRQDLLARCRGRMYQQFDGAAGTPSPQVVGGATQKQAPGAQV